MEDVRKYACALVTGASSGLGEEFAWQLAPQVRQLVLVARREVLLEELAEKLREAYPGIGVSVRAADLTDGRERARLVEGLWKDGWVPDLLVNNAGMGDYGEFVSAEWEKLEAMMQLNMEALTHLTHALVPGMMRAGRGAVVNVSSLASVLPIPDFAVYAATKAYVSSFSEALRIELQEFGIPVVAVCPGPVHTGFGEVAKRGEKGREMPGYEYFYVPAEQVVAESLAGLEKRRARVYPSLKVALSAAVIAAIPLFLLRQVLSVRPRRG